MCGCGKSTTTATKSNKPRTLAERWLNQYGIGNNVSSNNSRVTCKWQVDYLKLNDGLDDTPYELSSPKSKKKKNYVPSRSGPTTSRQRAQKAVTSPLAQVLACAPKVKSSSDKTITETTAATSTTTLSGAEAQQTTLPSDELSGIHPSTTVTNATLVSIDTVSGVQSTLAGVQIPQDGSQILATDDKLPNLVRTNTDNNDEYSVVLDSVPPVGEKPLDHITDGATTEEEFDAVDALLRLSTPRDTTTDNALDKNSSLMPDGGSTPYEDVNPVPIHLDQVMVDGVIAEIVEQEDILDSTQLTTANNSEISSVHTDDSKTHDKNTKENIMEVDVSCVQPPLSGGQTTLSGVQAQEKTPCNSEMTLDCDSEPSKAKGVIKVTTHGIKKKSNSDGRSYRCSICGVRKHSAGNLNAHHRRRHKAQMCGICGKVFELASSLTHHMYTHNERDASFVKNVHSTATSRVNLKNITLHITANPPINACTKTVDDGLNEKRTSYSMWRHTERI